MDQFVLVLIHVQRFPKHLVKQLSLYSIQTTIISSLESFYMLNIQADVATLFASASRQKLPSDYIWCKQFYFYDQLDACYIQLTYLMQFLHVDSMGDFYT